MPAALFTSTRAQKTLSTYKYLLLLLLFLFCFVLFYSADPPSLDSSFPYNHTVTEGNNLTLQCKVTAANPTPNITWYNVSTNKTLISYKDNLTFGLITRSHAGRYQCVVENGIGQAAVSRISTVDVQCKLIQTMLLRYWVSSLRFLITLDRFAIALIKWYHFKFAESARTDERHCGT